MATPPQPPWRRPVPSEGSPEPAPGPWLAAQRASRTPGKAEKILGTPVRVGEARWGRRMLIGVVVVAVLFGAIGWYRHLTRPPVSVRPAIRTSGPEAPSTVTPSTPSSARVPSSATTTSNRPGRDARGPLALNAKQLADALQSEPELTAIQVFDRRYRGREVTWAGTVTSSPPTYTLPYFEFMDTDGIHVIAWCARNGGPSAGTTVTVRGHLASNPKGAFVLERCRIL